MKNPKIKEIHFFDSHFSNGHKWYRKQFPYRWNRYLSGEATPYYLFHPGVPCLVASDYPKVKLIVILRNPIDRAYSHYQMELARGNEVLSFAEAIEREISITESIQPGSFEHQFQSYLARGKYAEQINRWLEFFDFSRFHFILFEQLIQNPKEVLNELSAFLSIRFDSQLSLPAHRVANYEPIGADTKHFLTDFFHDYNLELSEVLNVPKIWV